MLLWGYITICVYLAVIRETAILLYDYCELAMGNAGSIVMPYNALFCEKISAVVIFVDTFYGCFVL